MPHLPPLPPLPPNSPASLSPPEPHSPHWVVCLCADWCGVCRDYRVIFEQAALHAKVTNSGARFAWVDVEDQAELVGDLDVETFPTVLIADVHGVRFLGPVTPQAHVLQRLLDSMGAASQPLALLPGAAACAPLIRALPARAHLWVHTP